MSSDVALPNLAPLMDAVMDRNGKWEGREIRFRCPDPSHPDRHPSARYSPDKGVWHCDACGAGGGYITLADHLGVELEATFDPVRYTRRAKRHQKPKAAPQIVTKPCTAQPLPEHIQRAFWDAVSRNQHEEEA